MVKMDYDRFRTYSIVEYIKSVFQFPVMFSFHSTCYGLVLTVRKTYLQ